MNAMLHRLACVAAVLVALSGCKPPRSETPAVEGGPAALLGVWVPDAAPRELLTATGGAPPLTEESARLYADRKRLRAAGDVSFDPTSWCAGPGMPRILTMPAAFEIRRDGDRVAFIHDWYRWFRVVDLTPGEVEPPLPLTLGFPVGRWEGDSLVIGTVGLIDSTVMDASGLPHSEQLKLTERWRVLPDGRLESRITVDDPETFTAPWETVLTFHRDADARVRDDVCPDRLARGEPAEPAAAPVPTSARPSSPARVAAPAQGTPETAPRLSGLWEPRTFGFMVPDAPLSAAGLAVVDRNGAAMRSGRIMHTAWTSCRPGAVSTMTMPREKIVILQSPEEITLLFEMPRMVRRLRLDASHPEGLTASYVGDSVAHWEGGTLVVDTVGFNGHAELDARGQPTSAQLHTVERFTPSADGATIDIETTVTDPEYYTQPFVIKRAWKKSDARHPFEYDCMENPRKEDFENAYYVRDRYRPVCMRVEGEGMAPSRMVCSKPEGDAR